MKVNFEIKENYALCCYGRDLDLHNNFDFFSYDYRVADRQLTLIWKRSQANWIAENEFAELTIIHTNVSFLNIAYNNKEYEFPEDDKCLGEISFSSSANRETNNGFAYQNSPREDDDIIY
ncbi:MAG: hypothetical protein JWM28_1267, partial [Chitinophagaceae bacterium]|nr:hypothetical protein [Chitinophagaceae bacterium]